MAALNELIQKIENPELRAQIQEAADRLVKQKKFGLVFEEHLPECTPLYDIPIRKGAKVSVRNGKANETYTVLRIENDMATCLPKNSKETIQFAVDELVTTAELGDPIYPCLQLLGEVCNAPESGLWHTLIEADNYHALQLLEYLYAGKVDCIYIDPPYNTGARDWKYNNDYVDGADEYRHSKWLSFMQKRLELAKRLAAYARVSTEKEEQEDSFERQVQHYTSLITSKQDWTFGGIYADPGITGTRAEKRPDFMRMIQDCRDGKINKVLVKSISRFARNTVDALNYIRELKDLGISVYFENENIDTMTPGGEVLLTILAAMAEQESRTMSTNIKWSYQKKFQNGEVILNTGMVLGYKKNKDGDYVIAEEEAALVRRIFREYIAGIPVPQICKGLEADSIKTKRGSAQWHTNAVLGIIKNEKYTGNAILGKTFKPDVLSKRRMKNTGQVPMYYAENTHPAIIDREMFDMAQAEMKRRLEEKDAAVGTSRYTSKYPFSGLLVCGTCGHRLRRHVRTVGSGRRVPAWGCANRISNGRAVCDSHHINEDVLERTFRAAIDGMDIVIDAVQDACAEVLDTSSRAELEQVQQEIITIQEAVLVLHKDQQQGLISNEDYDQKVAVYSQQMDALQERQRELKATAGRYAEVKYWLDAYKEHIQSGEKMDTYDAVMIRSLTDKIVVYDDRMEIHLRIGEIIEKDMSKKVETKGERKCIANRTQNMLNSVDKNANARYNACIYLRLEE